jgi:hypothetical protein
MPRKDIRRHPRVPHLGSVGVSWEDARGIPKYALARCVEISEGGVRIETPEPIPVYTNVSLRANHLNLSGCATVKHMARKGSKYVLGLEMSHPLAIGR